MRVVLVGLIVLTTGLVLFVMPVSHGFSVRAAYLGPLDRCPSFLSVSVPAGETVAYRWSAPSDVSFAIWDCATGERSVEQNGTSGSGSFVSNGGTFGFASLGGYGGVTPPANVTGTYTGPLL